MIRYRGKYKPRETHPKITIYVHTRVAEVEYFRSFKNVVKSPSLLVVSKPIVTIKPQDMIKQVIDIVENNDDIIDGMKIDKDEVWVVLDVDDFYKQDKQGLIQIIKKAHNLDIKIAVSNECFELWYIMHFENINYSIKRGKAMEDKIKDYFKKNNLGEYLKNKNIFDTLKPYQHIAINNGIKSIGDYSKINWQEILDEGGNPKTTIHFLIKSIIDKCGLY